jgi:hypothetical protein
VRKSIVAGRWSPDPIKRKLLDELADLKALCPFSEERPDGDTACFERAFVTTTKAVFAVS